MNSIFCRLHAIRPKVFFWRGGLGKNTRTVILKTSIAKKLVYSQDSNLQPLDYQSTALARQLENATPQMLDFGYLTEMESRTQGSRPRPRTQKKIRGQEGHKKNPMPRPRTDFSRTDPLEAKDSNARGQGHRRKYFSKKKSLRKFSARFLAFSNKILTIQKIVLSSAEDKQFLRT